MNKLNKISSTILKHSVKSMNQCKLVIQTSYNIVKAHGGEIKVDTKENGGTGFTIILYI